MCHHENNSCSLFCVSFDSTYSCLITTFLCSFLIWQFLFSFDLVDTFFKFYFVILVQRNCLKFWTGSANLWDEICRMIDKFSDCCLAASLNLHERVNMSKGTKVTPGFISMKRPLLFQTKGANSKGAWTREFFSVRKTDCFTTTA